MFTFPVTSCDEMSISDGDCCDCFEEDGGLEIFPWGWRRVDIRVYKAVEDGSFSMLSETGSRRLTGVAAEAEMKEIHCEVVLGKEDNQLRALGDVCRRWNSFSVSLPSSYPYIRNSLLLLLLFCY